MGIWKCTKCGNSTTSNNMPLEGSCWKGGGHQWTAANNITQSLWRCSKCGNFTTSASRPMDRQCSKGGKCTWQKQH